MRILMISNQFPPVDGGTGMVCYSLLKKYSAYPNLWIDLVTSSPKHIDSCVNTFSERINIYSVHVSNKTVQHYTNIELIRYICSARSKCNRLLQQQTYDLSFAFGGLPAGFISLYLKRLNGLKYLLSLQGPDVPGFDCRRRYLYPLLTPILKEIWKRADLITSNSEDLKFLAFQTLSDIPITVIHNGVDTEVFYPVKFKDDSLTFLCVARLVKPKGQRYLLQAFARVNDDFPSKNLRLNIVGIGEDEDRLKELAKTLRIGDKVFFLGYVTPNLMPDIYRNADIFVLPSQAEGMSLALLEALASGLPVVVTKTGGAELLVSPGVNGYFVNWANVDELVFAMKQLVQSSSLRREMGHQSCQIASQFSWVQIAEQYFDLMKYLVN